MPDLRRVVHGQEKTTSKDEELRVHYSQNMHLRGTFADRGVGSKLAYWSLESTKELTTIPFGNTVLFVNLDGMDQARVRSCIRQ